MLCHKKADGENSISERKTAPSIPDTRSSIPGRSRRCSRPRSAGKGLTANATGFGISVPPQLSAKNAPPKSAAYISSPFRSYSASLAADIDTKSGNPPVRRQTHGWQQRLPSSSPRQSKKADKSLDSFFSYPVTVFFQFTQKPGQL